MKAPIVALQKFEYQDLIFQRTRGNLIVHPPLREEAVHVISLRPKLLKYFWADMVFLPVLGVKCHSKWPRMEICQYPLQLI